MLKKGFEIFEQSFNGDAFHMQVVLKNLFLAPSPGAITMVEVNLKITFSSGEWEKGMAIKDNVIIVEKVGIWPMCALLNIKLQQKQAKRKRNITQTANISYSSL